MEQHLDFSKKKRLKITTPSGEYLVRFPSVGELEEYTKDWEKNPGADTMREFIAGLGLPIEVQKALDHDEQQAVVEALTPKKK